jgi:hypothetical protein
MGASAPAAISSTDGRANQRCVGLNRPLPA